MRRGSDAISIALLEYRLWGGCSGFQRSSICSQYSSSAKTILNPAFSSRSCFLQHLGGARTELKATVAIYLSLDFLRSERKVNISMISGALFWRIPVRLRAHREYVHFSAFSLRSHSDKVLGRLWLAISIIVQNHR